MNKKADKQILSDLMSNEEVIITSIKSNPRYDDCYYTAINSHSIFMFKAKSGYKLYDKLNYDPEDGSIDTIGAATKEYYEEVLSALSGQIHGMNPDDKNIKKMEKPLKEASNMVVRSLLSGAPMAVRFHMDGDGASGAIALYKAFGAIGNIFGIKRPNVIWSPNKGVGYSPWIYNIDRSYVQSFESIEKPIILLTDFGTTPESEPAIKEFTENVIWLEHHPIYEGFPIEKIKLYINPWMYGMDSNVTAGFLTAEFASMIAGERYNNLEGASLISDHSNFADLNDKASNDLATVLDALTVNEFYDNYNRISPAYMIGIIEDKAGFEYVLNKAISELNESLDIGVKRSRKHVLKDGTIVYTMDYKFIDERNYDYMKHGRYTTKLHDRLEELNHGGNVTMVYFSKYISIRVSDSLVERVQLLKVIKELEDEDLICNGGGHNEAASIKVKPEEGSLEKTIEMIISKLDDLPNEGGKHD